MQKLHVYQSLWAMEKRKPGVKENSLAEHVAAIAAAGFDGLCIDPSVAEISDYQSIRSLCEPYQLGIMMNAFPYTADDMQPLLQFAQDIDAVQVNVIGGIMPLHVSDAVPLTQRWMDEADAYDMPLLFETHRDSLLNDLYFTLQLIEQLPDMRLCADLSHFVIDRELRLPVCATDTAYFDKIIHRSDCFQGRVASREQIQVQIAFPQHQAWVEQFKRWWRQGFESWRSRAATDATLIFLCELGPPPYAITDADQNELSNRFDEALTIKDWVTSLWSELSKSASN